ncbi:MAG: hypothetical protein Q8K72_18295, partial [Acidimicrobiales bacterium]|nr:hypothetical protein [Acidimicrobiales bacterium]
MRRDSLPKGADVTLVQFRALVLLDRDGALNAGRLAELLAVSPSTDVVLHWNGVEGSELARVVPD